VGLLVLVPAQSVQGQGYLESESVSLQEQTSAVWAEVRVQVRVWPPVPVVVLSRVQPPQPLVQLRTKLTGRRCIPSTRDKRDGKKPCRTKYNTVACCKLAVSFDSVTSTLHAHTFVEALDLSPAPANEASCRINQHS